MDGYPAGTLAHNVPFIVTSGLNSTPPKLDLDGELGNQGILVKSDIPPLESQEAEVLEEYFKAIDARGTSWAPVSREETYRFRTKSVGRSFLLPPRKAKIPEDSELDSAPILHSPFSPLSHVSALYPDGLIDSQWIKKHQELVPSILACFYSLKNDNGLKADINEIKATLARSGFKTRVAVIFFGDEEAGTAQLTEDIQDRLESIRKGTALDPKSIFYISTQESPNELKRVMDGILGILYTNAVEYYRDMGRHARKKRSRGITPQPTIPPTSGTSHTLSLPDWNFRYDFKTALFAEFRQEPDTAIRFFEQAYEILLGQDVLELIPSWSRRWDEARQLSDIISIRCLRLHLWMGHTTLAVRRWQVHRDRIGDFVDRRGHGTNTYGWQAWEARWATIMANLIEKVQVPGLVPASMTLFLPPEKAVFGERLQPWELLHHTGYWYRIAARHLAARRTLAHMMSDEDRQPPDSTTNKQRGSNHDTYMCPVPHEEYPISGGGVNHSQLIIDCLITARTQFQARKQLRISGELSLECAKEMASLGSWEEVVAVLRPVWEDSSFRSDNWTDISEDLCWLLRKAAKETGRADLIVAIDWEVTNKRFSKRPHWVYDLSKSLDGVSANSKPSVSLSNETSSPLISSSVVFRTKESKAGDICKAQLSLTSEALAGSVAITPSSVRIDFEGSLKPIVIEHSPSKGVSSSTNKHSITEVTLKEEFSSETSEDFPAKLTSVCDLTLPPGSRKVLELAIPLREAGETHASSVIISCTNDEYDLTFTKIFKETEPATGWYAEGAAKPRQLRADARSLNVQPRPPKMQITAVDSSTQYYTNEPAEVSLQLRNDEDEAATVKLEARIFGKDAPLFRLKVGEKEHQGTKDDEDSHVTGVSIGTIPSGSSADVVLITDASLASATLDVQIRATYHLESDTATPIIQILPLQLKIVGPFEANYDLVPRLHPDPWPSLFDYEGIYDPSAEPEGTQAPAKGFAQQWCLICHYASFASEDLVVTGVEMKVLSTVGGARCQVVKQPDLPGDGGVVSPKTMHEARFDLVAQKFSLDDRHPVTLDLAFDIQWKRRTVPADRPANVTTMLVGQYLVLGTEPRVLATALHSPPTAKINLLHLDVTVENPSNHFLTFGLTMEPSENFAFSGAKQTTVHLLPMSRRTMRYRLLPLIQGDYIRPGLVVRDKYFQKVLRIIPTEGMKIDKDGLLVWVPSLETDEDEKSAS